MNFLNLACGVLFLLLFAFLEFSSAESRRTGCKIAEPWNLFQGKTVVIEDVCLVKFDTLTGGTTLWCHPLELDINSPVWLAISDSSQFSGLRLSLFPSKVNNEATQATTTLEDVSFWYKGLNEEKVIEDVSFDSSGIGVKLTTETDIELLKELTSAEEATIRISGRNDIKLPEAAKTSISELISVWESNRWQE